MVSVPCSNGRVSKSGWTAQVRVDFGFKVENTELGVWEMEGGFRRSWGR